ncbi:MAG: hypothetical protein DRI46_00105 [Chloroflexi bacterium]|nr:MAG: hypothetical protein DRI46_00105 [Chloroflexota bacterium]
MKPIYKTILIGALVIGALGIGAIGIAYAQGDVPFPRETLANLLGLDREELHDQLQSGKTIQMLADDAGVDLEEFRTEMEANRQEEMRARIEEALADGKISQDQSDWLLEGLEKGYLFGPFFRPGGRDLMQDGRKSGANGERLSGLRGGNFIPDQQQR